MQQSHVRVISAVISPSESALASRSSRRAHVHLLVPQPMSKREAPSGSPPRNGKKLCNETQEGQPPPRTLGAPRRAPRAGRYVTEGGVAL